MDRRQVMINLRDRRQVALDDIHPHSDGYQDGDEHIDNMAINMESFYSSFKRRQLEEEKRRKSVRQMIKLLYLSGSFILIMAFSVFMNNEKLRMAAQPMLGGNKIPVAKSSASSSASSSTSTHFDPLSTKNNNKSAPKKATTKSEQRYLIIKNIVEPLSGKAAIESTTTPQYKALSWMSNDDTMYINANKTSAIIQRYAIAALYFATNGNLWTNSYKFLDSSKSECDWNVIDDNGDLLGVGGCDPDGSIKVISLWNNNLVGHVPREIALLKNLRVLSLYDNKLRGLITGSLTQLKGLKTLYLHGNNLVGSIDFLCNNQISNMRADCHGTKAEIACKCCQVCCNPRGDCYQDGDEV